MADQSSKTEKATPRKRHKAREQGQIPRSREVSMVATLLGMLLILYFWGSNVVQTLEGEIYHQFRLNIPEELTIAVVTTIFRDAAFRVGTIMIPILLSIIVISVGSNVVQGGIVLFPKKALIPKFKKLNPAQGVKKIFSKNGLMNLAKSLLLMTAIGIISWQVVREHMTMYPRLMLMDVRQIFHWAVTISFNILIRSALLMIIIAIADYAFQKYQHNKQLKMSKQEIKDEYKEMEGDPTTKRRIRRVQLDTARKRMMADVPTADVVITNPTHFAAALSYKMDSMEAPKLIAKGADHLAMKIKEIAREHNIPIIENKPLAQTLYKTVKVGGFIPVDLYKTVAEILAYVFKARDMYRY